MPGFRVSNIDCKSALIDKYPERCISKILGGGYSTMANPEQVFTG